MSFGGHNELTEAWIRGVMENRGKDVEKTLKFCNDIINYAIPEKNYELIGFAYYYSGETYYYLNDYNNFFVFMSNAITYLEKVNEWRLLAQAYNMMGISFATRGNAPIALDHYLKGVNYCRSKNLPHGENLIEINIGSLYLAMGQYEKAQEYLQDAADYLEENHELQNNDSYLMCTYSNLAKVFTYQKQYEKAKDVFQRIYERSWERAANLDWLSVWCAEAIYYHATGQEKSRDRIIWKIEENTPENMVVMDAFEDYYALCQMLLQTDKDEVFWKIVNTIESLIREIKATYLQIEMISLKIKYYQVHHNKEEYYKLTGEYYELSQLQEKENQGMITTLLALRSNLDQAVRQQQEMEIDNRNLKEKSQTDPLTGLSNRYKLNSYAEECYAVSYKANQNIAITILDIDYFKEFNDNYGHQEGDKCLKKVAKVIQEVSERHNGFSARYGGDEFVIIYEDITKEQALFYAEELKEEVMGLAIEHHFSKEIPRVTISQGVCIDKPNKRNRVWDFLHIADNMLYRVKRIGRNDFYIGTLDDANFTV